MSGLEPETSSLPRKCSTAELHRLVMHAYLWKTPLPNSVSLTGLLGYFRLQIYKLFSTYQTYKQLPPARRPPTRPTPLSLMLHPPTPRRGQALPLSRAPRAPRPTYNRMTCCAQRVRSLPPSPRRQAASCAARPAGCQHCTRGVLRDISEAS